jgi:hypothetical protein
MSRACLMTSSSPGRMAGTGAGSSGVGGMVKLRTAGGVARRVEISAEILRVLRERAEAALGGDTVGGGDYRAGLFR